MHPLRDLRADLPRRCGESGIEMPTLEIDNRQVEVAPGETVLAAARKLGIEVPTLCHVDGLPPATSCMVCIVKVRGRGGFCPSCATLAEDGMVVESETDEVRHARRAALELLLSDHLGDCMGPCQVICPAHMGIPLMIRQIAGGRLDEAIDTVKRDIALPAVLGRICPAPCESGCRRKQSDSPLAICLLKRYVADADLAKADPYLPSVAEDTHKRVAIVGAGPAGLAAAFHLRQMGHACTVFDDRDRPGGALRDVPEDRLPPGVLDAEIAVIEALGVEFQTPQRSGEGEARGLPELRTEFDAVLLAVGKIDSGEVERFGLEASQRGIAAGRETYATSVEGVFAAGNAVRGANKLAVRALADGKEASVAVDQFLRSEPLTGAERPFNVRIGRLAPEEVAEFVARASAAARVDPTDHAGGGFSDAEARAESARCLHCDCRKLHDCSLRSLSRIYKPDPRRYKDDRRVVEFHDRHPEVIYEPGKCITCGLCVRITERAAEPLGLTFIGRGFDVRVGVPFEGTLAEGLQKVASECVAACPTAALAWKDERGK